MRRLAALVLMLVVAAPARAATVPDLYQADVPVAGRDEGERARAIQEALRVVLVKVTGDRAVTRHPEAGALVRAAARYGQQYQYLDAPAVAAAPGLPPAPGLLLRVVFGQAGLDAALAPTGLPLWGRERPATLLWLAVDDGTGNSAFLGAAADSPLAQVVLRHAARRGLPLVLPALDAADAALLGARAAPDLAAASARYGTPAVAGARLRPGGPGAWEAAWTLAAGGTETAFASHGAAAEAALEEGLDLVADALAARYAAPLAAATAEPVRIVVADVQGTADYARAQRYLASLDIAGDVQTAAVEADRVAFALQVRGGLDALARTVALGSVLVPVPGTPGAYRLRR